MKNLFEQMLGDAVKAEKAETEKIIQTIETKKAEISSKELTEELSLELEEIGKIEEEITERTKANKKIVEEPLIKNLTQELQLKYSKEEVQTVQYMITPSTKQAVDEAYRKYKNFNKKITKGGLVEFILRKSFGLDTKDLQEKMGIK